MHTDLIARLHSRWACDGDSLDWVGVAERAAPALVGLAFEQPAVDALGVVAVSATWKGPHHLPHNQRLHAERALGLGVGVSAIKGRLGKRRQR